MTAARNRAVNRLVIAALAHAEDLRRGYTRPSNRAEFMAAVDDYLAARDPFDEARDEFLTRYPTPADLSDAVARRRAERLAAVDVYARQDGPQPGRGSFGDAALRAEAEASVRLDGETVSLDGPVVAAPLPDGDPCPCGPNVYPGCPIHDHPTLAR